MNYPAAYPGVIAVGAVARDGQLAPFSSRHSYVSLTAPGVDLIAATPPDAYARISSTSASSGIVAGVAALILSRYPHLTVAQVTQALTGGTTAGRTGGAGAGHGIVDAARAVNLAAAMNAASQPSPAGQARGPAASARAAAGHHGGAPGQRQRPGRVPGPLCRGRPGRPDRAAGGTDPARAIPAGAGQGRRGRSRIRPGPAPRPAPAPPAGTRGRPPGADETSGLTGLAAPPARPGLAPPGPATTSWSAAGGWQGVSMGEIAPSSGAPNRPVMTPAPKPAKAAKPAASPRTALGACG